MKQQPPLLPDPQPAAKRGAGILLSWLALLISLPALWHLCHGLPNALALANQQMGGNAAGEALLAVGFPIVFAAYPLYWAVALGDSYFLVEQLTAFVGIVILLKSLDIGGYEVPSRPRRTAGGKPV